MPPGRFGLGKISSRYFAIGAKITNLAGMVLDRGVSSQIKSDQGIEKTCPARLLYRIAIISLKCA